MNNIVKKLQIFYGRLQKDGFVFHLPKAVYKWLLGLTKLTDAEKNDAGLFLGGEGRE